MEEKSSRLMALIQGIGKLAMSGTRRFPATLGVSFAAVVLGILINHTSLTMTDAAGRAILVLLLGIPLTAAVHLVCEKYEITAMIQLFIVLVLAGLGAVFYLLMPERLDGAFRVRYSLLMAVFIIFFTLVPYLGKRRHYAIYVLKLVQAYFITYLYTAVIAGGLSAILGAVNFLLGIRVDPKLYGDVWMIAAGIFGLLLFLGKVPSMEAEFKADSYPAFFRVLFVNIVLLLFSLFTVVFYIYLVQTIFGIEVLKGLVGRIILSYGLLGAFLFMAVMPLAGGSKWARWFVSAFPFVFVMPLAMLFIALSQRIGQYGWTANRHLVLMAGIWLLLVLVYGILAVVRKKPVFEQRLAAAVAVLLLVSAAGPQSAVAVGNRSQAARLEETLAAEGMLSGGKVVANPDLDARQQDNIRSMVGYLYEFRGLERLDVLPDGFVPDDMKTVFGFEKGFYYYGGFESVPREYVSYYYDGAYFIDISGYDVALSFDVGIDRGFTERLEAFDAEIAVDGQGIVVARAGRTYPRITFEELLEGFEGEDPSKVKEQKLYVEKNYGFGKLAAAIKQANGFSENGATTIEFVVGSLYIDFRP